MKPPSFTYMDPTTVPEVLSLLANQAGSARVLAGGQSLLPLLNLRLARPEILIDINRVEALHVLRHDELGLTVGATCRQRELERFPGLAEVNPLLAEALPLIGHFQIRNRGTVCGSLAYAHPAAELPAVAVTAGAEFTIQRQDRRRVVPAQEFFVSPLITAMEPDELLTQVRFPAWRSGDGWAIEEVARRQGGFALVGVVAVLSPSPDYRLCTSARLTVFGTGKSPQRMARAEAWLAGNPPSIGSLDAVVAQVRAEVKAEDDIHAPASYRQHVAGTLARQALLRAANRAGLATEGLHG